MARRIMISPGLHKRFEADMSRRLKAIVNNYKYHQTDWNTAMKKATRIIDTEYQRLLIISRQRVSGVTGRQVTLPKEERKRLETWKNEFIKDFGDILRDAKRSSRE